uniref:Acyl-CoA-binding domain-containing protein 3 n=1 Tax=Anthurium amnicola TaxID=1678845 RepID=A0A1D1XPU1_9ARAE
MELLLELLLTMLLSVLIAFLLGKIVSIAASDEDDTGARGAALGAAAPSSPRGGAPEAALPGSRLVFTREVAGEAAAVGGIPGGLHAEGREVASARVVDCIGTVDGRGVGEVVHVVEEESVVEGEGVESEEVRAMGMGLQEADGGEEIAGATVDVTEANLAKVTPEEIGLVKVSAIEEKLMLAKDGDQMVHFAPSPDEDKAVAEELGAGEVGTESIKIGEGPAMVETDDVKVDPSVTAEEVGSVSENVGPEMSVDSEKIGSLVNEDDDWEGIEKSDLEKLFGAATAFVCSAEGNEALSKLSNDVQMQLYGFHKIATEGPCYESQPLALKVSARARWHAWQRLGSMNPEMAMEKYVALLSDSIPGWMPQKNGAYGNPIEGEADPPVEGISGSGAAFSSSLLEEQLFQKNERKVESPYIGEYDVAGVSEGTEQGHHPTDSSFV